jgi:hypothetical protein
MCEPWSLTLREERRLRVFGNRVLRGVLGPNRKEETGWTDLITRMNKERRTDGEVSLGSATGMVTGYGLENRGVGVRVPLRSRISTSPIIQTSSGVQSTSYPL